MDKEAALASPMPIALKAARYLIAQPAHPGSTKQVRHAGGTAHSIAPDATVISQTSQGGEFPSRGHTVQSPSPCRQRNPVYPRSDRTGPIGRRRKLYRAMST